jgi:hypothetical protein
LRWTAQDPVAQAIFDIARGATAELPLLQRDEVVPLVYRHGLIPQYAAGSPEDGRPIAHRLQARQGVMVETLRRLLVTFDRAGVDVAVLKGPFLGEFVYEAASERTFTDLDLLVRPADLDRAIEVLMEDPGFLDLPVKRPTADKRELLFFGPAGISFNIDLHWDLFGYAQLRGSAKQAVNELWAHSAKSETSLGPMVTLPMWGNFVFLCTHATLDHRFRLVLFRDLAQCLNRGFDLERAITFSKKWQMASEVYIALLIVQGILGTAIPSATLAAVRPNSAVIRYLEGALPKTDLVRFDGHRIHPVNLAFVLMHDSPLRRIQLLASAPAAFPGWVRRVARDRSNTSPTTDG